MIDGGVQPAAGAIRAARPDDKLEIDPAGGWLIVHGSEGLVSNPNELILIDLQEPDPARAKRSKTLDSYGGKPKRFVFTSELMMPDGGRRRLLVVQREKDLAILDLSDRDAPETRWGCRRTQGGYPHRSTRLPRRYRG